MFLCQLDLIAVRKGFVQFVTGGALPLWSTLLLARVEILKLSTDNFETRIQQYFTNSGNTVIMAQYRV